MDQPHGCRPAFAGIRAARRCLTATLMVALIAGAFVIGSVSPASADAKGRRCTAKGYKLAEYTTHKDGYNRTGQHMWRLSYHKRWCYSVAKHSVGSWHHVWVWSAYGPYGTVWKYRNSIGDAYYDNRGPTGKAHPNFPQWSHRSYRRFKVEHCLDPGTAKLCSTYYYRLGIIGYWDGSKKLWSGT